MKKPELTESTVNKKLVSKVSQNFSFGSQHEKKFNREDFFPDLYLEKQKKELGLVRAENMKVAKDR